MSCRWRLIVGSLYLTPKPRPGGASSEFGARSEGKRCHGQSHLQDLKSCSMQPCSRLQVRR